MTLTEYVAGVALLALFVVPLAAGAWAARAVLVPEWRGAPARLAEAVLTIGALVTIAEVLGSFDQLRRLPLALACVVVGVAVALGTRSRRARLPRTRRTTERRRFDPATFVALGMAAVVAARWWAGSLVSLDAGIVEIDSRQYHLPMAAFFARTGSTVRTRIGWLDPVWSYYPAHGEVAHAIGMLAFRRDVLSPILNMGWLALALLAGWCIGRPWGRAPATLAATALLLGMPVVALAEPGSATNDIVGLAFFLSAIALLVTADGRGGGLAIAGFAAGLAMGTKLTLDFPVAGLTIAALVLGRRNGTLRTLLTWGGPLVVGAAFWYLHNLFVIGNPVPAIQGHLGPLALHGPAMPAVRAYSKRVIDDATYGWFWRTIVHPALHFAFGPGWVLLLGIAAVGVVGALVQRKDLAVRLLSLTAVVAFAGYLVTPGSAYGVRAEYFNSNVRYAFPALALGLILFPLLPGLRRTRVARDAVVGVFAVLLVITALSGRGATAVWPSQHRLPTLAAGMVLLGLATWLLMARRRTVVAAVVVLVVLLVVVAGYRTQRSYLEHRYTTLGAADRWARGVHHARIGMTGYAVQYPLFGLDLTNSVDYVGRRVAYGGIRTAQTCQQWRQDVNRGRYSYLVTGFGKWGLEPAHEADWTRGDPNAVAVSRSSDSVVFALRGPLNPAAC